MTRHTRPKRTNDLQVIIAAKDLCSYIFAATQKSPKVFRFSLVGKMQNLGLEVIENLYRANAVFIKGEGEQAQALYDTRLDFQYNAYTSLRLLEYLAEFSYSAGCITAKQLEVLSKYSYDCGKMLNAWIESDKKRFGGHSAPSSS